MVLIMKALWVAAVLLLGAGCGGATPDATSTTSEGPAPTAAPSNPEEETPETSPPPSTTTTAAPTTTARENNFGYTTNREWDSAVAMNRTIDLRAIANHLGVDDATALDAIDQRGIYICRDVDEDQTPVGLAEAMQAASYDLGLDFDTEATVLATLAIAHICPNLTFVVADFNAAIETIYPTTTVEEFDWEDPPADQVIVNVLLIDQLQSDTAFRDAFLDLMDIKFRLWDRLDRVSGLVVDSDDATEDVPAGLYVVIEATSGYLADDNQEQALFDIVYDLATDDIWADDYFGATTDNGNGAVGLDITTDGKRYVVTGERMLAIRDRTMIVEIAVKTARI